MRPALSEVEGGEGGRRPDDGLALDVSVLTPPGRGAVAVIECHAPLAILDGEAVGLDQALCRARDNRPFADRPVDRITFARWGAAHPEDVVVCRTSESTFEVHCHGGSAAVERIVRDLDAAGSRGRGWSDQQERSPGRAPDDELTSAAWSTVTHATTLRTADLLLHQAAVAWPALLQNRSEITLDRILEMRRWSNFGRHLTEPWSVALVGRPNAGKSSLMNALAGFQRSIVNPTPGTTRDAVTLDVAFQGWPIRLVDTAGLRETSDDIETAGIERARRAIADADLVLHVIDSTTGDEYALERSIPVWNKCDLSASLSPTKHDCSVSALTGEGIPELIERIVKAIVPHLPPNDLAIPVCVEHERFLSQAVGLEPPLSRR